jgi:hypothetical protein
MLKNLGNEGPTLIPLGNEVAKKNCYEHSVGVRLVIVSLLNHFLRSMSAE